MNRFFTFLGYGLIIFGFLDFVLSWLYPDLLMSWYLFSKKILGGLAIVTPVIFYLAGSFLIKFASNDNANIEDYNKSQDP
ncbi:MAG: hypothetical protein CMD23_02955 [Flavobacteriales bacterium]|nr:hypothetical protein [Flavobacteriales bacterium]